MFYLYTILLNNKNYAKNNDSFKNSQKNVIKDTKWETRISFRKNTNKKEKFRFILLFTSVLFFI